MFNSVLSLNIQLSFRKNLQYTREIGLEQTTQNLFTYHAEDPYKNVVGLFVVTVTPQVFYKDL
jgi:hypothetical protein